MPSIRPNALGDSRVAAGNSQGCHVRAVARYVNSISRGKR